MPWTMTAAAVRVSTPSGTATAFSAGTSLNGYATILRTPVVAATQCAHCRILDRTGQLLAHQSPYHDYAMADVLVDQPLCHLDFQWEKIDLIRREQKDVSVFIFDGNATFTLTGSSEPKVLQSLIDQYDLTDIDDYIRRAESAQDKAKTSGHATNNR